MAYFVFYEDQNSADPRLNHTGNHVLIGEHPVLWAARRSGIESVPAIGRWTVYLHWFTEIPDGLAALPEIENWCGVTTAPTLSEVEAALGQGHPAPVNQQPEIER